MDEHDEHAYLPFFWGELTGEEGFCELIGYEISIFHDPYIVHVCPKMGEPSIYAIFTRQTHRTRSGFSDFPRIA